MSENIKRILCRTAAAAAVNVDISQTKPSRFVRPYFEMNGFSVAQNSILVNARKCEALPWSNTPCSPTDCTAYLRSVCADYKKISVNLRAGARKCEALPWSNTSCSPTDSTKYLRGGYAGYKKITESAQRKKNTQIACARKCGALPWSNTPCSLRTARRICVVGTLNIKRSRSICAQCVR